MADLHLYICAGEPSGDVLGAQLISDLHNLASVNFSGIGGPQMIGQGLSTLFDMAELSVMGFSDVLVKLPKLFALIDQTVEDIIAKNPDCVVYIDAQDFSKRVARKVRRAAPHIRQILYVAPTVWVWRSGRAKQIAPYIDHILAIFPFEPEVMKKLDGPPTTYVGHPLLATITPAKNQKGGNNLLFLPGSRGGELKRHLPILKDVAKKLHRDTRTWQITIPTLPHLKDRLDEQTSQWAIKPKIVTGEAAKSASFSAADAALAVSGTITLELACAHIPQIVIYQSDRLLNTMAFLINAERISFPNIILAQDIIPEYINKTISIEVIDQQLRALASPTTQRQAQQDAYQKIAKIMQLDGDQTTSSIAGKTLLTLLA